MEWAWPDDEEVVDAYLVTLRMFVQENDIVSVHRLSELYRAISVEQELLARLTLARRRWLQYLRQTSHLISELPTGELRYTHAEVLDLVLYGDRAHLDLDLRERYESWYSSAGSRAILETRLCKVLDYFHVGIMVLRDLHLEIQPGSSLAASLSEQASAERTIWR
ncbi:MAG: hypothetical protein ACREA0_12120 [bacterium]